MLKLPRTLPEHLRTEFESALAAEDSFCAIARLVRHMFSATEVLGFVDLSRGAREVWVRSEDCDFTDDLIALWNDSGIGKAVIEDLKRRSTAVSFSSFGWPFPHDIDDERSTHQFPRDYTLFIPFSSSLVARRDDEPEFFGYFAVMHDELMQLDDDAIAAVVSLPVLLSEIFAAISRDFASSDERLATLAHDVKQYLLLNQEFTYRLNKRNEELDDSDFRGTLTVMDAALQRMLMRTSALLLSDRNRSGLLRVKPVKVNLNEVVSEAVEQLQPLFEVSGVKLSAELDQQLPEIAIDPAIFPSVIHNLLDNSLKYSLGDGVVSVRTLIRGDSGQTVVLEVSDDGIGVPDESREDIFSAHYRAENAETLSGNGLGLYLVNSIVEAHGGQVGLVERDGAKTTFAVELPVENSESSPVQSGEER